MKGPSNQYDVNKVMAFRCPHQSASECYAMAKSLSLNAKTFPIPAKLKPEKVGTEDEVTPKGPYIKDVRTGRGEGGSPKADIVREVAWI